ncbi:MAG: ABC transporter permease [Polyangiaceae bacterium]|nr:ABC transporter permease [Polyangiaceae bacterium]
MLGVLALFGIFAEWIAAPAPLVATEPFEVLPAVMHAERFDSLPESAAHAMYRDRGVIWPVVRAGARTPTSVGAHAPPSRAHPLGTDAHGRDLFARLVYGARTALGLSLGAIVLSVLAGIALGGLAGVRGGFWNDTLVRLVETVDTFPAIIVVALVRAMESAPSAMSLVIAVAIVRWAEIARLVRAEVVRASAEGYVLAARALGASPIRIFYKHILRNAAGPILTSGMFGVASIVLLEATISFLAIGAATNDASWGETMAQGAAMWTAQATPNATTNTASAVRLLVAPGLFLMMTVVGSYLFAEALRNAMEPKTARGRLRAD